MTETFDPSKYLTKVGGSDYLEVKWRLVWLRDAHPDASIETELMQHTDQFAVFRARITLPSGASATGWGSETYGDFRDFIEKAETKAIGRALAALGFGTQFCPDFEFGGANGKVVDAPVSRPNRSQSAPRTASQQAPPRSWSGPSDKQLAAMRGIGERMGLEEQDLIRLVADRYDVDQLEKLTGGREGTASAFITWLNDSDKDEIFAKAAALQTGMQPELVAVAVQRDPDRWRS